MEKNRQKIAVVKTKGGYTETDCEACIFHCPFENCPLNIGNHFELK